MDGEVVVSMHDCGIGKPRDVFRIIDINVENLASLLAGALIPISSHTR